jgi:hypothetical protein
MPVEMYDDAWRNDEHRTVAKPRHVRLRISWPEELQEDPRSLEFVLDFQSRMPESADWVLIGAYATLMEARRAAEDYLDKPIAADLWVAAT